MARFRSELAFLVSFLLTLSVILNAFYHKKQFYPSIVYLTKSNSSMAVIYLQAFVVALLIGKLMNKIFFGQLRAIEMEHLFERSWYAITETCLAFTVFRDDFSPKFVTMFTLLLFLKCFHWLAEDRVDYMERSPVITFLFHARIVGLITLLKILDTYFVFVAYNHTMVKGASVQLVFGFEYAILFVNILSTFLKYLLHTIDIQNENPWENKGIYMLYGDLCLGFVRVILYLTFMSLMIKIHTFPLFAIRPMYLSVRSFKKSLNDVIMSRRAIRNLNIMYPDVTPEQLRNYSDTICIICREEMATPEGADANNQQIKKLPCDHIFHKSCLRSWFQRQQTCPTCRTSILRFNQPAATQPAAAQAPAQPAQQQQPAQAQAYANNQQPPASSAAAAATSAPSSSAQSQQIPSTSQASSTFTFPTQIPLLNPSTAGGLFNSNPGLPLPPFAFMPPPLPPLNLSGLSAEELAEMEGNERHNVEARIHCLRNVNTLLNASMVHIQQYMNICAATSHLENLNKTKKPFTSIQNDLKLMQEETASTSKVATNQKGTPGGSGESSSSLLKATESATNDDSVPPPTQARRSSSNLNLNENENENEETSEEKDAIRKRRLQHFEAATTNSIQQ